MKNFRDSTFPCSAEPSFLGSLHGQERNAICEANRESESMHPLSERDRAKKDYGKVESFRIGRNSYAETMGKTNQTS